MTKANTTDTERQTFVTLATVWLRVLIAPDQVVELRALHVQRGRERPHSVSGFFDTEHLAQMAELAIDISKTAKGVYFTMNPLRPDILARRANRIDYAEEGKLAKDADVVARRWLLIDADPIRDAHVSSTDAEKAAALKTVQDIRTDLAQQGWPEPILGDSGNGYHLLFRIDLQADDSGIIQRCLKALAAKYDTPAVHIDQAVFNASRICKFPGTVARKGDNVQDRPHRRARLLDIPTRNDEPCVQVVPGELLEALAALAPILPTLAKASTNGTASSSHPSSNGNGEYQHRLLVDRWLQDRGIEYRVKPQPDRRGRAVFILKHCPFDSSHGDPDSCIMQAPNGALSAHCFHSSCAGRGWQGFKEAIGNPAAEHYDPPMQKPKRQAKKQSPRKSPSPNAPDSWEDRDVLDEADDDPHRLAKGFLQRFQREETLTLRYWREEFHRWDGRAYRPASDEELRAEATQYVRHEFERLYRERRLEWVQSGPSINGNDKPPKPVDKVTIRLMADVLQALRGIACSPFDVEQPAWLIGPGPFPANEVLVCYNGILHLPTWAAGDNALHPLTPRLFSPTALDYPFEAEAAKPKNWLYFLSLLWPHDPQSISALQEWFGYCLLPDTSQQKIMMLVGPKRSGKGTIARVLSRLIGLHNVASPTLGSLGTPFGLQPLLYKTLAIISDARLSHRSDSAVVLERLLSISGEDAQTVDRKFLESLTLRLSVRFMILTNELPKLHDPSGALVGRLILLRMTKSFYGREDTALTADLLRELPGILLWAIEGWKRLRQRGRFQQPDSSSSILQQMDDLASPVSAFIRERCEIGPGFHESCTALFEAWKGWTDAKGMKPGNEQTFGRDLHAVLPGIDTRQPRSGSKRFRVYIGIRLRMFDEDERR